MNMRKASSVSVCACVYVSMCCCILARSDSSVTVVAWRGVVWCNVASVSFRAGCVRVCACGVVWYSAMSRAAARALRETKLYFACASPVFSATTPLHAHTHISACVVSCVVMERVGLYEYCDTLPHCDNIIAQWSSLPPNVPTPDCTLWRDVVVWCCVVQWCAYTQQGLTHRSRYTRESAHSVAHYTLYSALTLRPCRRYVCVRGRRVSYGTIRRFLYTPNTQSSHTVT